MAVAAAVIDAAADDGLEQVHFEELSADFAALNA